jgi:hypothetical protein
MKRGSALPAKLVRPRQTGAYRRSRLFTLLDRARPVAWVSGPPGAGKTTLVASYVETRRLRPIWYQVDEGDADAATLFYCLRQAAVRAAPRHRWRLPPLTPEYLPGLGTFTRRWFEELFAGLPRTFVLVFDNYQAVPPESLLHQVLRDALETLPERGRAVLVSRSDPPPVFARARAEGKMVLVEWEALRLTQAETAGIALARTARRMQPEQARALHSATDGWAAGLVLMLERKTADGRGQTRDPQPRQAVFDYFASEILARSDAETRQVLLDTALLPKVTSPQAETLTAIPRAGKILADLARRRYFTDCLPDPEPTYQYHPLFREFLLARGRALPAERREATRKTAAALLEERGQIEDAAELFGDARDWEGLARLVATHAPALFAHGRGTTVEGWLRSIPRVRAEQSPRLLYWMGICVLLRSPADAVGYAHRAVIAPCDGLAATVAPPRRCSVTSRRRPRTDAPGDSRDPARSLLLGLPASSSSGAAMHVDTRRSVMLRGSIAVTASAVVMFASRPARPDAGARYGALPLAFEENSGQTDSRVRFVARGAGYTVFLTQTEAVLRLRTSQPEVGRIPSAESAAVVRMRLPGANRQVRVASPERTGARVNYFVGSDPASWRTDVPTYERVRYRAVYPGIDLVFHGSEGQLEYDFIVSPRADPRRIRLEFDGVEGIRVAPGGDLLLSVAGKQIRQRKPTVYQDHHGVRTEVEGRYALDGRQVRFAIASYDRSRPLVIDPVLSYSTYLGGTAAAYGNRIAVDGAGNGVIVGVTDSLDFPTVNGGQPATAGDWNAFVAKLSPDGTRLVYATYLGGSNGAGATAVALDAQGSAYVTGITSSSDFPTTPGAFGRTNAAGNSTAFVAKLDAAGGLLYSTYLDPDSSTIEYAYGIAVDGGGNAYVAGTGRIPLDYPYYPWPSDAFLARIDPNGSALLSLTYIGGSDYEAGNGVAVDREGNAYVTGTTMSSDFPTVNAFQDFNGGFCQKAFVTKVAPDGSVLYSTYLGGNWDVAYAIAVDAANNIYLTGNTHDGNFPATDPADWHCGDEFPWNGAFVAKLDAGGTTLQYARTFSGWTGGDSGSDLAVDAAGRAYVTGTTVGSGLPTTPDALQPRSGTEWRTTGFVLVLDPAGSTSYASYLGGVGYDYPAGIALDSAGNAYVTGTTSSSDFPVTAVALQRNLLSSYSAFVTRISFASPTPGSDVTPPDTAIQAATDATGAVVADNAATLSSGMTFAFAGTDDVGVARFECRLDGAPFAPCASPATSSGLSLGAHTFEVRAVDMSNNADATPAQRSFFVDAPPETTIATAADGAGSPVADGGATLSSAVAFAFSGSDNAAVARYECRLDGSSFATCSSPARYAGLGIGRHDFAVRAIDSSGFADPTPAIRSVVIESAPDTWIVSATDNTGRIVVPGGTMRGSSITFRFAGSDNTGVSGFECSLDGGAFAQCANPKTYSVSSRTHTFRVRAFDSFGFRDPTPAQFSWTR